MASARYASHDLPKAAIPPRFNRLKDKCGYVVDIDSTTFLDPISGVDTGAVRLHLLTEDNARLVLLVKNVLPYFYVDREFLPSSQTAAQYGRELEQWAEAEGVRPDKIPGPRAWRSWDAKSDLVTKVEEVNDRLCSEVYSPDPLRVFKVTYRAPKWRPSLVEMCQRGWVCAVDGGDQVLRYSPMDRRRPSHRILHGQFQHLFQFMCDTRTSSNRWVSLEGAVPVLEGEDPHHQPSQYDFPLLAVDLKRYRLLDEAECPKGPAPGTILGYDIEVLGRPGYFPDANQDPVIQIGMGLAHCAKEEMLDQVVLVLDGCTPLDDGVSRVVPYRTERALLEGFFAYIRKSDATIITGFNIDGFDTSYVYRRALKLGIIRRNANEEKRKNDGKSGGFKKGLENEYGVHVGVSRRDEDMCRLRVAVSGSKQKGHFNKATLRIPGRIVTDMMLYAMKEHKLRSYTLNAVATTFIGQQKDDIHHSLISVLHRGSPEDRRRLAKYCLKDALLPIRLCWFWKVIPNGLQRCLVTNTLLEDVLHSGETKHVVSAIVNFATDRGFILPDNGTLAKKLRFRSEYVVLTKKASDDDARPPDEEEDDDDTVPVLAEYEALHGDDDDDEGHAVNTQDEAQRFKEVEELRELDGATVLDPIKGYHTNPIICEDFEGLYPSIIMAHNLCMSTLIPVQVAEQMPLTDVTQTPTGHWFVKKHVREGILPALEAYLKQQRGLAKKEAKSSDPNVARNGEGRQLALKLLMNSIYGWCKVPFGVINSCFPVAASITGFGREMIAHCKWFIEKECTVANGWPYNARVVYGDTDSVMVDFGPVTMEQAFEFGIIMAKRLSEEFVKPINMEFENVYGVFLLMAKKCYYATKFCDPNNPTKMKEITTKGATNKRRNPIKLVGQTLDRVIEMIMVEKDVEGTKALVRSVFLALWEGEIDLSRLMMSAELRAGEYKVKQKHSELAKRMKVREPGSEPKLGERVYYTMRNKPPRNPKFPQCDYDYSEHPNYMLEHDVETDAMWFIEHQLQKPITRFLLPVIGQQEINKLFERPTKTSHVTTACGIDTQSKQTLFGYMTPKVKCVGCGQHREGLSLCSECRPRKEELLKLYLDKLRQSRITVNRCWSHCQRCTGNYTDAISCVQIDCPVYCARQKAVKKERLWNRQVESVEW